MAPDDIDPDFRAGLKQDVQHAHRAANQGGGSSSSNDGGDCLPIAVLILALAGTYVVALVSRIGVLL